jgi:hypothetical protein
VLLTDFAEDYRILVGRHPREPNRVLAERMGLKHKTFVTYCHRARRAGLLSVWRVGDGTGVDIARQGERNGARGSCGARRAVYASASPKGRAARRRDLAARAA